MVQRKPPRVIRAENDNVKSRIKLFIRAGKHVIQTTNNSRARIQTHTHLLEIHTPIFAPPYAIESKNIFLVTKVRLAIKRRAINNDEKSLYLLKPLKLLIAKKNKNNEKANT